MATVTDIDPSTYTVTTFEVPGAIGNTTAPTAINNHDEITGYFPNQAGEPTALGFVADLVNDGGSLSVQNFGTIVDPNTSVTEDYGIDNAGDISGSAKTNDGAIVGFRDAADSFISISDTLSTGTDIYGLNDLGDVVGSVNDTNGMVSGYLVINTAVTKLDIPGDGSTMFTFAFGINNGDTVVGSYRDDLGMHGFIEANGSITTIDEPDAVGETELFGINNNGQISGGYEASAGVWYPFVYQDGNYSVYNQLPMLELSHVGINDLGQLVGRTASDGFVLTPSGAACYCRGTHIMTPSGEVTVEDLRIGDLVLTISGASQPIKWIGQRSYDRSYMAEPASILPILISAGAFGPAQPHRDLWLSPDHAVFVDGALIPVKHLVNNTSIRPASRASFTYYHIELARHDVLLAEGLPAESYLDTGDRSSFSDGGAASVPHPDASSRIYEAEAYAPLLVSGPRLEIAKQRLNALAVARPAANQSPQAARVPIPV